MSHFLGLDTDGEPSLATTHPEVYASAAAFYVVLVKNGFGDEATEFAEWFLDTFDIDLET